MRKHRGNVSVSTSYEDEETGEETSIDVECKVTPGSRDYFDRSFGNWLPGDPPEVEILSARSEDGKDWTDEIESDAAWLDRVETSAMESANEQREAL